MEDMPADEYLALSYYERWIRGTEDAAGRKGHPDDRRRSTARWPSSRAPGAFRERWRSQPSAFKPGDRVRVKAGERPGHIRHAGVRARQAGLDRTRARRVSQSREVLAYGGDGLPRQPLYMVGFRQTDLWQPYAESATRPAVRGHLRTLARASLIEAARRQR